MFWLQVKQFFVIALATVNLVLLIWALLAHRQRRVLPAGYYRLLPASAAIGLVQVSIGMFFLIQGRIPYWQHVLYGALVGVGAVLQFVLLPGTPAGQQYRNRPLVHAAVALFVALVGIRSWMTG
ncbi:hypothetical protein [Symbiobacterium thermophilum]|uniref:Uncharacterized protein n=1 Tax=Symbiobacterium thermophilum (strain DSM 24528 / JCM 14929 / IAM 14863 / T) TaxID=292459 RepID=Q67SF2_SYMTH|nr:hypothetical protein [Symbiobacterium thermophilum]BAD39391.1 hypothetical protein STH406 [Symbiobacterium thermophilum IAM 14863]